MGDSPVGRYRLDWDRGAAKRLASAPGISCPRGGLPRRRKAPTQCSTSSTTWSSPSSSRSSASASSTGQQGPGALVAIYIGTLFAAALYGPTAATADHRYFTINRQHGRAHLLPDPLLRLLGACTALLANWFGDLKMPRRIAVLDNLGGAALGIIVSGLAVTLAPLVLAITLQAINHTATVASGPGFELLREQIPHLRPGAVLPQMAPFYIREVSPGSPEVSQRSSPSNS